VSYSQSKQTLIAFYTRHDVRFFHSVMPIKVTKGNGGVAVLLKDFFKSFPSLIDGFGSTDLEHLKFFIDKPSNDLDSVVKSFRAHRALKAVHPVERHVKV